MVQFHQLQLCDNKKPGFISLLTLAKENSFLLEQNYLSLKEKVQLSHFKTNKRRESFLAGRVAAKAAIEKYVGESFNIKQISVENGLFRQPFIDHVNVSLSISHSDEVAGSVVGPAGIPLALDIERISSSLHQVLTSVINEHHPDLYQLTLIEKMAIWSGMEALSKVIQTGFTTSLSIYRVNQLKPNHHYIELMFKYFPSFLARCYVLEPYVITLVLPKNLSFPDYLEFKL